ncbi:MAG: hypothetical protein Q4A96_03575 [Candidatus Saccharibacteria bacterium]|nr:hypothetical protein [Candidatus Saccharibacteria bacterium]
MGKIKQLTNIAAATVASVFGIASFAGNASAANTMELRYDSSATSVQVCKRVDGLQGPYSDTFIYDLTNVNTNYIDLRGVTVTSATGVSYSSSAAGAGVLTLTIDNNNGASSTAQKCATLDFSGAFTNTDMLYGEYTVNVTEKNTSGSGDNGGYYADDPLQEIEFSAYLDVDSNGDPISDNTTGNYGTMIKAKATPNFTSTASYTKTHISLKKQVKGNKADPTQQYDFTVVLTRKYAWTGSDNETVHFKLDDGRETSCTFTSNNVGATCTKTGIKLAHNEMVLIGITGNTNELVPGGYSYTITENLPQSLESSKTEAFSDLTGQTSVQTWNSGDTGTRQISASDLGNDDQWLFVNTLSEGSPAGRFFMILPFVILAIIAGGSVVVLRKTSKKEA